MSQLHLTNCRGTEKNVRTHPTPKANSHEGEYVFGHGSAWNQHHPDLTTQSSLEMMNETIQWIEKSKQEWQLTTNTLTVGKQVWKLCSIAPPYLTTGNIISPMGGTFLQLIYCHVSNKLRRKINSLKPEHVLLWSFQDTNWEEKPSPLGYWYGWH